MEIEVTLLLRLLLELFKGWALRNNFFLSLQRDSNLLLSRRPAQRFRLCSCWHEELSGHKRILVYMFGSLAKAYHYQMNLIKWSFRILKEHTNFSCVWKFEPDIPNSLGEILLEKPQNLQRMYEFVNVLPPSNFAAFNCCYFLCYWSQRAETFTSCLI